EDPGQHRGEASDQHGIRLAGRAADGADDGQDAGQTVLGAEDRFADLAQDAGFAALALQVVGEPGGVEVGGSRFGARGRTHTDDDAIPQSGPYRDSPYATAAVDFAVARGGLSV